MEKYIFLDFDGVLNTEHYQNLLYHEGESFQDEYGAFFDPEAVEQLKRIIDATQADIVIQSSWKYLGLEAMQEMWKERAMPGKVIDITPSSVSDNYAAAKNYCASKDARLATPDEAIASSFIEGINFGWLSGNSGYSGYSYFVNFGAFLIKYPNSMGVYTRCIKH